MSQDDDPEDSSSPEELSPSIEIEPSIRSEWSEATLPTPRPPSYFGSNEPELPSIPAMGDPIAPSHLKVFNFGSRFLPHTTSQIRALLPLMGDRLLLIGHDDGLSVMDMFPSGDPETSGPADAVVRTIWEGEG